MINIILTGHGQFASGLYSAAELITGPQDNIKIVDFSKEMSTEQLTSQLQTAITELPAENEILFLTDLLGGSPFRSAVQLSVTHQKAEVITGTNLQMLCQVLMERDDYQTAKDLANEALEWGKQGILIFKHSQPKIETENSDEEEGI